MRAAIEKAKKVNMPAENIERAIKKANESSANMENISYEAYGPGGVGIIIETLTDNKNRTAQDIKFILSKNNLALGGIGSVAWAFKKESPSLTPQNHEGLIWTPITTTPVAETDLEPLEKLINELEEHDDIQEVFTNAE